MWLTDYYWFSDGLSVCCQLGNPEGENKLFFPRDHILLLLPSFCPSSVFLFFSQSPFLYVKFLFVLLVWHLKPNLICLKSVLFISSDYISLAINVFFRHMLQYILYPSHCGNSLTFFSRVFLQPEAISTFTSEPALVSFAEVFCKTSEGMKHVSFTSRNRYGLFEGRLSL